MRHYTQLFIWENAARLRNLEKFTELILDYIRNVQYETDRFGTDCTESDTAKRIRSEINERLLGVREIVEKAGVSTIVDPNAQIVVPAPSRLDLFLTVFSLHEFGLRPDLLVDRIERALGVYRRSSWRCWLNIINPLLWLVLVVECLTSAIILVGGSVGIDQAKMRDGRGRAIVSFLGWLIVAGLALLAVPDNSLVLDQLKRLMQK